MEDTKQRFEREREEIIGRVGEIVLTSESEETSEEEDGPITQDFRTRMPRGWKRIFKDKVNEVKIIEKRIKGEFLPPVRDIFRAFRETPLNSVKVVIVGQDPYHNGSATGMSFSVRDGNKINPSLRNILKALKNTVPGFYLPPEPYPHGDLTSWAKQGVLLLNKDLTVEPGNAGSHKGIWNSFLECVIKGIRKNRPKTIFLLWGVKAQLLEKGKNYSFTTLKWCHPSSFNGNEFHTCTNFVEANELLMKKKLDPIDWNLYERPEWDEKSSSSSG